MKVDSCPTTLLERDVLLKRLEGDADFLCELIAAFEESHAEDLRSIGAAIQSGSSAALEESGHALKGSVQNFASGKVVELAYALERMGRDASLSEAADKLEELKQEVALVRDGLRRMKAGLEEAR